MFKKTLVTMLMAGLGSIALPAYAQSKQTGRQEVAAQAVPERTAVVSISAEIQKGLSKKMPVMVDPDPQTIPVGSLVITGCILKAEKGSSAGRMIGMNVGASRLSAHLVIFSKGEAGFTPVDAFDPQVKGGSVLPPLGPIGREPVADEVAHLWAAPQLVPAGGNHGRGADDLAVAGPARQAGGTVGAAHAEGADQDERSARQRDQRYQRRQWAGDHCRNSERRAGPLQTGGSETRTRPGQPGRGRAKPGGKLAARRVI